MNTPRVIDISVGIDSHLPTFPGDPKVKLERVAKMEEGSAFNLSKLDMGVHTATHVDAPYHFIADGGKVDALDLGLLIGPAEVIFVDAPGTHIGKEELVSAGITQQIDRLLVKTRNSAYWGKMDEGFQTEFAAFSAEGAQYLVDLGVKVIGIDYFSAAPFNDSVLPHQVLLSNNLIIIEGLDLRFVEPGRYELICLPIKLLDCEGAPARCVLIDKK